MAVLGRDRQNIRFISLACLLALLSGMGAAKAPSIALPVPSVPALVSQFRPALVSAGTRLAVRCDDYVKILVTRDEILPLTLTIATPIRTAQGTIAIPQGSQIVGEIRPSSQGSQFVAQKLIVRSGSTQIDYSLAAASAPIARTETITANTNTVRLARGTLFGKVAASSIAEVTGDRTFVTEATDRETGIGLLAGWFLNGSKVDLIAIDPNRDLTLTLQSPLRLSSTSAIGDSGL